MSELVPLEQLTKGEKADLKKIVTLFSEGRKSDYKACKLWVDRFSPERRAEIMDGASAYQRQKLAIIEGVGLGLIHPSLLFATHTAAKVIRSFDREKQDKLLNEGVPVLRKEDKGKMVQRFLSHEEMSSQDVSVAFEYKDKAYSLRSRAKQKAFLLALTNSDPEPEKERGWGVVKGEKFYPASIWRTKGMTKEDLQRALAELEKGE